MSRLLNLYDEAIPLVGAMRVMAGELPHRDFYSIYGPAPYYALAALFRIFGANLLVERLFDAAIKAVLIGVFSYLAVRHARPVLAAVGSFAVTIWLVGIGAYGYVIHPVALLGIASTALLLPADDREIRPSRALPAGMLIGLAALFRYDLGGFIAMAHCATVASLLLLQDCQGRRYRDLFGIVWCYALGCGLAFGPAAVAFVGSGGLPWFAHDVFGAAAHYAEVRRLPWPSLGELAAHADLAGVYLPFVALGAAAICALTPRTPWRTRAFLALFAGLTAMFLLKGVVRVSLVHMLMAVISGTLLLTVVAEQLLASGGAAGRIGAVGIGALLLTLSFSALDAYPGAPLFAPSPVRQSATAARLRPGFLPSPFSDAARFVEARTAPSERIFVGRFHHDRFMYNALAVYFASGRLPGTRWHHFDPGVQTRADVQSQIAAELERNRVRFAILSNDADAVREPNASATSSGVHVLDQYLRQHFCLVADWGVVQVWERFQVQSSATPMTASK
jgi:hypothetical protein